MGNNIDNETQIELCFDQSCSHIDFTSSISIGFAVESISHIVSKLNNMKIDVIYGPIETAKFKWITIKDPNGLLVQFFESKSTMKN